jgi:hypothetical protein
MLTPMKKRDIQGLSGSEREHKNNLSGDTTFHAQRPIARTCSGGKHTPIYFPKGD